MFQVRVSQQDVKARLNVTDPMLYLQINDPEVQISSQPLQLEIHQPAAELVIDNYPSDYSRGIKNNMDFDRDNARKGMQTVYAAIGKIASEGVMLSKIENKGNPLAQLAKASMDPTPLEITIASVAEPSIRVTPHEAEIRVVPGRVNIGLNQGTVDGELQRGTVDLTMLQYPNVSYRFVDSRVDIQV
ncbi:putative protein YviE [Sporomusa silvacetica DSM 10669]|uniref:Uncharacterized protein n=1 Tax=Sporomusa silvacetica DSM 10669 TaxID=1123289 RepID=A0ABZ3IQU5_9FIRM|nr:DUF6470 family protein [Sporomusa silvacetica]OZC20495.1 hypothetical protein SPSIL_13630 [Sporomusa silvacetica DSM 10669]